jgi:hypothetical protein
VANFVPKENDKVEVLTRLQETHVLSWFSAVVTKVESAKVRLSLFFLYPSIPSRFFATLMARESVSSRG